MYWVVVEGELVGAGFRPTSDERLLICWGCSCAFSLALDCILAPKLRPLLGVFKGDVLVNDELMSS